MSSLLTSLRKYRPRENSNPVENFITEAFAWLLRKDPDLGRYLVNQFAERLINSSKKFTPTNDGIVWSTQANYGGVFPDMEAKWPGMTLVFEHKVWAELHGNQLNNYRDFHTNTGNDYRLILITGHHSQHGQNPDLALCWHEVYVLIKHYLDSSQTTEITWLIQDFLELLKTEGLGPAAPISHTAIYHYQEAITLRPRLEALMARVFKHKWSLSAEIYQSAIKNKEGVLGIQFARRNPENNDHPLWAPGIFIGFCLDGWDHRIESRLKDGLKMCLNISISENHHDAYPAWSEYKELVKELADKVSKHSGNWTFYNHRAEASPFNPWHPLYLEYPMLEVFKGTETTEQQEQRFIEIAEEALVMLTSCEAFAAFECKLVSA